MTRSVPVILLLLAILAAGTAAAGCTQPAASSVPSPHDQAVPGLLSTVPDVRQSQEYSCGAASLQAVLNYWGITMREGELIREMGTTNESGTPPDAMIREARAHGLHAELRTNVTPDELEALVTAGVPVIITCQAWRDPAELNQSWDAIWEDGHYMVVIGMDKDNVYFEDPVLLGTRGYIPRDEFLSRWHDYLGKPPFSNSSVALVHPAIIIRGTQPAAYPSFTRVE